MLCPNDHLRLIVELMREGGMELTRRWVAALVLVAPEDRESLVAAIEERVAAAYDLPGSNGIFQIESTTPEPPVTEVSQASTPEAATTEAATVETKPPRKVAKKKTGRKAATKR